MPESDTDAAGQQQFDVADEAPPEGMPQEFADYAGVSGEADAAPDAQDAAPKPEAYEVEVDGEKIEVPLDELRKGYMRQAAFTRRMQEHADRVKAADAIAEALRSPEGVSHLLGEIRSLAERNGWDVGAADTDGFEYSDEGATLRRQIEAQSETIRALQSKIESLEQDTVPFVQSQREERALAAASSEIEAAYGAKVSAAQIKGMMEATGISDPVLAFKAATFDQARKMAYVGGHRAASGKPVTPPGAARTVDFDDPDMSASEAFRLAIEHGIPEE